MEDRDIIIGHDGAEVDITEQMDQLFDIYENDNFRDHENAYFIESFGRMLVAAAGPDAPANVINDYADDMEAEFVAFLRVTWQAITSEHD
jgi:hypothetical protein